MRSCKKMYGLFATAALVLLAGTARAQLYVSSDLFGYTVGEYDTSTGAAINANLHAGEGGLGIAVDGSGHLFAAGGTTIGEYNASTGATINASFVSGLDLPAGIALDGSGDLFVANYNGNTIGEYNASTGAAINASLISGLIEPLGIAVDGNGNLFVTSVLNNEGIPGANIGKYNANTGAAINDVFINSLVNPIGLAFDGSGNLIVADNGTGALYKYNASTGEGVGPPWDPHGAYYPIFLAIAPVPEPSTFALAALAATGLLARRRATINRKGIQNAIL